jgi:hypothetical protein
MNNKEKLQEWPSLPKPDYEQLCLLETWQLDTACAISLDVSPIIISKVEKNTTDCYPANEIEAFKVKYKTRLNVLMNYMESNILKWVKPEAPVNFGDPLIAQFNPQKRRVQRCQFIEVLQQKQMDFPKTIIEHSPNFPEPNSEDLPLRIYQRLRERCRAIAEMIWEQHPEITITQLIQSDLIFQFGCEREFRSEKAMRSWINDLCPNRGAGRRSKENSKVLTELTLKLR